MSVATGGGLAPSGQFPAGTKNGENSAGENGWTPPCPPEGDDAHTYRFALYAIPKASGLEDGASPEDVRAALEGRRRPRHLHRHLRALSRLSRGARPAARQRVVIDGSPPRAHRQRLDRADHVRRGDLDAQLRPDPQRLARHRPDRDRPARVALDVGLARAALGAGHADRRAARDALDLQAREARAAARRGVREGERDVDRPQPRRRRGRRGRRRRGRASPSARAACAGGTARPSDVKAPKSSGSALFWRDREPLLRRRPARPRSSRPSPSAITFGSPASWPPERAPLTPAGAGRVLVEVPERVVGPAREDVQPALRTARGRRIADDQVAEREPAAPEPRSARPPDRRARAGCRCRGRTPRGGRWRCWRPSGCRSCRRRASSTAAQPVPRGACQLTYAAPSNPRANTVRRPMPSRMPTGSPAKAALPSGAQPDHAPPGTSSYAWWT